MSGGRWQTLRKRIIGERGERCENCGSRRKPLEAHEIWEYYDAKEHVWDDVSSDGAENAPDRACRLLEEFNAQQEYIWRHIYDITKHRREMSGRIFDIDAAIASQLYNKAVVLSLSDIKLLCRPCHRQYHGWDHNLNNVLVIAVEYGYLQDLPNFKTYKEWLEWKEEEIDLYAGGYQQDEFRDDDL
jgi:hypothetical protein